MNILIFNVADKRNQLLFDKNENVEMSYENTPRASSEDGYFVFLLEPAIYLDQVNLIKDHKFKYLIQSPKVSDNPILYFVKMKAL